MKAITLYQPWASLWLSTRKVHETRSWATKYRGPLAVHAGKREPRTFHFSGRDKGQAPWTLYELCCIEFGHKWMSALPLGGVLGVVELIDCRTTTERRPTDHEDFLCGNWEPRRFAWQRGAFRILPQPIPYRGHQGFFDVPDHLVLEHPLEAA